MKRLFIILSIIMLSSCLQEKSVSVKDVIKRNSWLFSLDYVERLEPGYEAVNKEAVIIIYVKQSNKLKAALPTEIEGFKIKVSYLN